MSTEYYYRAAHINYAPSLDQFDEPMGQGRVEVVVYHYAVAKHTPKGVRLENGKFVSNTSRRRFANPTREEAIVSYLARKEAEISIYQARIKNIKRAMAVADYARDIKPIQVFSHAPSP